MAAFTFKHGDRPLEGYTIQRGVGRGGFGEVYFAVSDGGREVALKYLRDNPAIELRGVTHCMNLKSPYLVTIFDVRKNPQDEYFVVMEYVQGPSLRDILIAEPNGLGVQKASFFLRELAKGLSYLHERGIVHRDMKPGNIFYEDGYVKIGDYGLSKFISVSRHSAQTASVGTVHYMAPEVGSGSYHRGIDIYALGVMLYEMLLGRVPYDGSSMGEVLMKHLTAQPEVDELPEPFPHVIRKALAKDPKDRYQTVDEMAQDVLGVEHVQESLAGFNPRSLTVAAGGGHDRAASPMPSPNPLPATMAYGPGRLGGAGVRMPDPDRLAQISPKLAARIDRVGAKIDRKLDQLDHKFGRRAGGGERPPRGAAVVHAPNTLKRRWLLGLLVLLGFAIAFGVVAGLCAKSGKEEAVASGIMGVLALVGGTMGARKAQNALGATAQPKWVKGLVTLGCAAPLIAISMIPATEGPFNPGIILGLIAAAVFVDWEKRIQCGVAGELKGGQAFSAGLGALILTAICTQGDDESILLAAGVAATASLAVQGVSWFIPPRRIGAAALDGRARRRGGSVPPPPVPPAPAGGFAGPVEIRRAATGAQGMEPGSSGHPGALGELLLPVRSGRGSAALSQRRERSAILRAFWSVTSFALLAGVVVSSLSAGLLRNINVSDRHATLCVMVVCFAALVFAARKVRINRRPTFWQETLRPLLQSVSLVGIGVPIVCLAVLGHVDDYQALGMQMEAIEARRHWERHFDSDAAVASLDQLEAWANAKPDLGTARDESSTMVEEYDDGLLASRHAMNDGEYVAAISVLVISSMLFLVLLFTPGRRRVQGAFVLPGAGSPEAHGNVAELEPAGRTA